MMAQVSDATGQFLATCFDDAVAKDLEDAARVGGCGLVTVELDRRPGEEAPRVSIKRIQPFENLASQARFVLEVAIRDAAAFRPLAALLSEHRGAKGEVRARLTLPDGGEAMVMLGRDFLLDAELAEHVETLPGVTGVEMKSSDARLALVG